MTTVIICDGGGMAYRRRLLRCPIDMRITEFAVGYPASPWYDPILYCTACGLRWSDGEMWRPPFQRGWRAKWQAEARALWRDAPYGPEPPVDWEAWGLPADLTSVLESKDPQPELDTPAPRG